MALASLLKTRNFSLVIAVAVAGLLLALSHFTPLLTRLELATLDIHFNLKRSVRSGTVQEGVVQTVSDPRISPDILIVGVDFTTLNQLGRWPFARWIHADFINSFQRISDQGQRERSLFLDFFFIEPSSNAYEDARLAESIARGGRVFLETIVQNAPPPAAAAAELFERHAVLYQRQGRITNITGNWTALPFNQGLEPPLQPLAAVARGFGHANFYPDGDEVFRRQPLIVKLSRLIEEFGLDELTLGTKVDHAGFERLAWFDIDGFEHSIAYPLNAEALAEVRAAVTARAPLRYIDRDGDGTPDESSYIISRFQDQFVPSITLALALDYFNKSYDDIEVVVGEYIRIPDPFYFNVTTGGWEPYRLIERLPRYDRAGNQVATARYREIPEIRIPIDERGTMQINFMGRRSSPSSIGSQTYPVRPYVGYLSRAAGSNPADWPPTLGAGNKIVMVGAFSSGLADDEKPTPLGLMYGIEMHANALNTIVMDNFINTAPFWLNLVLLAVVAVITGLIVGRVPTLWATIICVVEIGALFLLLDILFDRRNLLLNFGLPALVIIGIFLGVVVYRVFNEEREKRHIRDTFGRYVSPNVVKEVLSAPPELGGVDREISVFFSDIRGFTTLSESLAPQQLIEQLNMYFTAMTEVILEYNGTLDKYVGDEIMCFWGAPVPQADHAILACRCALQQTEVLGKLNRSWPAERRLNIGIGINSGIMTVGNVGSTGRLNYTLIGDNVNLGARLEGTNKQYGTNIIISEYTQRLVGDRVITRELDNIRVKGKSMPVVIYELLAIR